MLWRMGPRAPGRTGSHVITSWPPPSPNPCHRICPCVYSSQETRTGCLTYAGAQEVAPGHLHRIAPSGGAEGGVDQVSAAARGQSHLGLEMGAGCVGGCPQGWGRAPGLRPGWQLHQAPRMKCHLCMVWSWHLACRPAISGALPVCWCRPSLFKTCHQVSAGFEVQLKPCSQGHTLSLSQCVLSSLCQVLVLPHVGGLADFPSSFAPTCHFRGASAARSLWQCRTRLLG